MKTVASVVEREMISEIRYSGMCYPGHSAPILSVHAE